jgi:hypothetical protein
MRVNLCTRPAGHPSGHTGTTPVMLTIRPACGIPGDYEYATDSQTLLRLLRQQTDLPGYVLDVFEQEVRTPFKAQLRGVELSESVLTDIGYFVD